ncbi:MAG: HepT-like ribonuclease domain-containing protein, partial [Planctomycetota bacterium]
MVDKNVVLRKISELETYQKQIEEFSDITIQEYKSDWKLQRIIERTLQMMIETCVDIAHHII